MAATAYPAAVDAEFPTLEQMRADLMRAKGYGMVEDPASRYVTAAEVVAGRLGGQLMQEAAAEWLAAHPAQPMTLPRRIRRRIISLLTR